MTCPAGGLLGQVQGRTADDAAYWLAGATPAWRDAVQAVCIDLCSIYASAVRRMLPDAVLTADLFHVVQLAVKAVGDVRRRVVRPVRAAQPGRRPRVRHQGPAHTEPGAPEPDQFAKVIDTLDRDRYGQEIAAAWIAKEKLRDVLNLRARIAGSTPCQQQVRDRLFAFYDWCAQHDDIPELITLARTISRWEDEITAAVLTGITNATSESLNRLAKLEARQAYGFPPGQPAPPGPDRLHPRIPAPLTHSNLKSGTSSNRAETRSRLQYFEGPQIDYREPYLA